MTTNGDSPIVWSIWQASSCRPHKGLGRGECHMNKKTVRDVDVAGKRVLVRVAFNVPLRDRRVFDDTRIRAALPTIEYLRGEGAKVILVSHLGRPDGREDPALRLDPVVRRLSDLLGVPVRKTAALVGLEVTEAVGALRSEGVLVLENSRFHPGETQTDQTLSTPLPDLAESDCTLHLPQDVLLADRFEADAELRTARADTILNGWMGVDVGQDTALDYGRIIAGAGQVFWNGPMGAFEILPFGKGTRVVAQAMANCGGVTVVGGGDSLAAVNSLGLSGEMDHVSTGGGASLEYLEGSLLPGLDALEDA